MNEVISAIAAEVVRSSALFPAPHSPHEALGVITEEFEEYRAEVFRYNRAKGRDTRPAMEAELIQLAAMCVRAILSLNEDI